jgi:hypothetical protein
MCSAELRSGQKVITMQWKVVRLLSNFGALLSMKKRFINICCEKSLRQKAPKEKGYFSTRFRRG